MQALEREAISSLIPAQLFDDHTYEGEALYAGMGAEAKEPVCKESLTLALSARGSVHEALG
jgi:hypothetical protein